MPLRFDVAGSRNAPAAYGLMITRDGGNGKRSLILKKAYENWRRNQRDMVNIVALALFLSWKNSGKVKNGIQRRATNVAYATLA